MLTVAFDESTMSRTQVQLWFKESRKDDIVNMLYTTNKCANITEKNSNRRYVTHEI